MKFYAYIPTKDGREPVGTSNRIMFELKTIRGAVRRATRQLGTTAFRLYSYRNFFCDDTFTHIYENGRVITPGCNNERYYSL